MTDDEGHSGDEHMLSFGDIFRWCGKDGDESSLLPYMVGALIQIAREHDIFEIVEQTLVPLVTSGDTAAERDVPEDAGAGAGAKDVKQAVPLRTVYWFVTNYAKKYGVTISLGPVSASKVGGDSTVNIYNSYCDWIARSKRSLFDVYRRGKRHVFFEWPPAKTDRKPDRKTYWTTVAQLNFALWAHRNQVLGYIRENLAAIQADRDANRKKSRRRTGTGTGTGTGEDAAGEDAAAVEKRRRMLSHAPIQQCLMLPSGTAKCDAFSA
jgi:hypothetical protein